MTNKSTPKLTPTKLSELFPQFTFKAARRFSFRPPRTIYLGPPSSDHYDLLALHELGHALCRHRSFQTDIDRLKKERAAWDQTKQLCQSLAVNYDSDFVEQQIDSYRDWLHSKSKCPHCHLTRFQTPDRNYHCPHCDF